MSLRAGYKGIKKYVADTLNKMNPGDSFATDAEIAVTVQQIYADMGVVGAKNLFPLSLTDLIKINNTGSWNNNVYTLNDVTFTVEVNSDGTVKDIKANGQASGTTYFILSADFDTTQYEGMLFNGLPEIGSTNSYAFRIAEQSNWTVVQDFYSNNTVVENNGSNKRFGLRIVSGYNPNNAIFKPMIRLASDTDPTYQPYAQTNRELTVNKANISALGTQEGATASRLYHVGEHFYKDGKFCTVIGSGDVAAESTWTLNTNYIEGTIADYVKPFQSFDITAETGISFGDNTDLKTDGKSVIITAQINSHTYQTGTINLGTIPSDYKPSKIVYTVGIDSASGKAVLVYININGRIAMDTVEDLTSATIRFNLSYPL